MSELSVNWKDFDPARLSLDKPVPGSFDKPDGTKGSYVNAYLKYSYPTSDGKGVKENFYLEMSMCDIEGFQEQAPLKDGAQGKPEKPGSLQVKAIYNIARPDTKEFIKVCDRVYSRILELIIPYKMDLKTKDFSAATARALCKHILYLHSDPITGEIDENRSPSQYYKIYEKGRGRTRFYGLKNDTEFNIPELRQAQYSGIPLIAFDKLYSGGNGKISIQYHMASIVIKEGPFPIGSNNRQKGTIEKIRETNPDLVAKQESNHKALLASMQELTGISVSSATSGAPTRKDDTPLSETPVSLEKPQQQPQVQPQQSAVPMPSEPARPSVQTKQDGIMAYLTATTPTTSQGPAPINPVIVPQSIGTTPPPAPSAGAMAIPGLPPGFQMPPGFQFPPGMQVSQPTH